MQDPRSIKVPDHGLSEPRISDLFRTLAQVCSGETWTAAERPSRRLVCARFLFVIVRYLLQVKPRTGRVFAEFASFLNFSDSDRTGPDSTGQPAGGDLSEAKGGAPIAVLYVCRGVEERDHDRQQRGRDRPDRPGRPVRLVNNQAALDALLWTDLYCNGDGDGRIILLTAPDLDYSHESA